MIGLEFSDLENRGTQWTQFIVDGLKGEGCYSKVTNLGITPIIK